MENQTKKVSTLNDAISVLVQGVQIGQTKGVYSFEDSTIIGQALEFLKMESQRNAPEPKLEVVDVTEKVSEPAKK